MIGRSQDKMLRQVLAVAVVTAVVLGAGLKALATARRDALPGLEGAWSARMIEPVAGGMVEETRSFDITFGKDAQYTSRAPSGAKGEGNYKVSRGRALELKGPTGSEIYSILPLNEKVVTIYREGSQKAIYLVRK